MGGGGDRGPPVLGGGALVGGGGPLADSCGAEEPKVRRLTAGGNRIRTIGPAVEETPFPTPDVSFPRRICDIPREGPKVRIHFPPAPSPLRTWFLGRMSDTAV